MKKNSILCISLLLLLVAGTYSCDKDTDLEQGKTKYDNGLVLYDTPKSAKIPQEYGELIPNTQPPFTLLVIPVDEEGREIINELSEGNNSLIEKPIPYPLKTLEGYWITSMKYFESPHLYVSVNHMIKGAGEVRGYVVYVFPVITIKMKEGYDINTIKEKYNLTYISTTGKDMWYDYRCPVNNAVQVIQLANKIENEKSVEWTSIHRLGDAWII